MEYRTKIIIGGGNNKVILMTDVHINHMVNMIGEITTEYTGMLVSTIIGWFLEDNIVKKGSFGSIIPGEKITYMECV